MNKARISAIKKSVLLLGVLALTSVVAALTPTALGAQDWNTIPKDVGEDPPTFTLTILHNNNGESKLLPDPDSGYPGVARFVYAMHRLRWSRPTDGVITLSSGDNFLASKEFNVSLQKGPPYYDSIALSGGIYGLYDALAVGNLDMDFGPDIAAEFISGFNPAVVFLSANLDVSNEPKLDALAKRGRLAKSTSVGTHGADHYVYVIGAVTPQLPNISSPRHAVVSDVADAVNAEVAAVDPWNSRRVILVSHLESVSEDLKLVPKLSGVDIVISGGGELLSGGGGRIGQSEIDMVISGRGGLLPKSSSTCLPGEDVYGTYPLEAQDSDGVTVPIVTVPGGYRCIGRLVVTFDHHGKLISYFGHSIGVDLDGPADQHVVDSVERPLTEALKAMSSNVLATSEVALGGRRTNVRTQETNEGALVADALLAAATGRADAYRVDAPQVALMNGGGIRNDSVIPPGPLSEADTFDITPFSNFVGVMEVPRQTFKTMLEQAVDSLPEARGQFPQIAGFTMSVDSSRPAREIDRSSGDCALVGNEGSRIREVTLNDGTSLVKNGRVIPGDPIRLATIGFLARGGDCYPFGDLEFVSLGITDQKALAEFLTNELNGQVTARDYPEGGSGRININGQGAAGPLKAVPTA